MSSAADQPSPSDAPGIEAEEDTTVGAETLAGRPGNRRRRRRRRLTDEVKRRLVRNNLTRVALGIVLGLGVIAFSTYLAHKSTDFDMSIIQQSKPR